MSAAVLPPHSPSPVGPKPMQFNDSEELSAMQPLHLGPAADCMALPSQRRLRSKSCDAFAEKKEEDDDSVCSSSRSTSFSSPKGSRETLAGSRSSLGSPMTCGEGSTALVAPLDVEASAGGNGSGLAPCVQKQDAADPCVDLAHKNGATVSATNEGLTQKDEDPAKNEAAEDPAGKSVICVTMTEDAARGQGPEGTAAGDEDTDTAEQSMSEPAINPVTTSTALVVYDPNTYSRISMPARVPADHTVAKSIESQQHQQYKGLNNLGNTCYLNSALQMLCTLDVFWEDLAQSQVKQMTLEVEEEACDEEKAKEGDKADDMSIDEDETRKQDEKKPEESGVEKVEDGTSLEKNNRYRLRDTLLSLSSSLRDTSPSLTPLSAPKFSWQKASSPTINPKELKAVIDELTSQFAGFWQQDAHEFLSTLIDLLHDEAVAAEKEDEAEGKKEATSLTPKSSKGIGSDSVGQDISSIEPESQTKQVFNIDTDSSACHKKARTSSKDESSQLALKPSNRVSSFADLSVEAISDLLHGEKDDTNESKRRKSLPMIRSCAMGSCETENKKDGKDAAGGRLVGGRAAPLVPVLPELRLHEVEDALQEVKPSEGNKTSEPDVAEPSPVGVATATSPLVGFNAPSPDSSEEACHKSPDTPVERNFTMEIRTKLTCDSCKYARTKLELYRHLSIDIGSSDDAAKVEEGNTIEEGLRKFFAPEKRELKCEKCFCESATQTTEITRLPRALLVHFKRFIVDVSPDYSSISYRKNQSSVEFSTHLDLSPDEDCGVLGDFLAEDVSIPGPLLVVPAGVGCDEDDRGQSEEHEGGEEVTSLGAWCGGRRGYKLRSVVNHIGSSANCGHYTADGHRIYDDDAKDEDSGNNAAGADPHNQANEDQEKKQRMNKGREMQRQISQSPPKEKKRKRTWTRFNDSHVSKIEESDAVGSTARKTAYMVLYELE